MSILSPRGGVIGRLLQTIEAADNRFCFILAYIVQRLKWALSMRRIGR